MKKKRKKIKMEKSSGNVFKDLGLPNADKLYKEANEKLKEYKQLEEDYNKYNIP